MSGLLIAAEIQELVAVAHDGFPLLFEQSLKLRKVLDYDTDAYLTRTHRGEQLVKFVGQRDVREFVHTEMDMHGKPAAVDDICLVIKLLEHLRIEAFPRGN